MSETHCPVALFPAPLPSDALLRRGVLLGGSYHFIYKPSVRGNKNKVCSVIIALYFQHVWMTCTGYILGILSIQARLGAPLSQKEGEGQQTCVELLNSDNPQSERGGEG